MTLLKNLHKLAEASQEKLTESELQLEILKDQVEGYERDAILSEASQDLSENEFAQVKRNSRRH